MQRFLQNLLALALIAAAWTAFAGVPSQLSYQGVLEQSGSPLAGSHAFTFRLYDQEVGGTFIWTETDSVAVDNEGVFSATLGASTPIPVAAFDGQTYWLETEVDGNLLAGRRPLLSVANSFHAQTADTAAVAQVALSGGSGSPWQTDGTNVWRSSGKVGVGTDNPLHTLHVVGPFDAGNNVGATLESDDGGTVGPVLDLYHNTPSPAANDLASAVRVFGNDAGANKEEFASIAFDVVDPSAGNEGSSIRFRNMTEGALGDRVTIKGRYVGIGTTSPALSLDLQTNGDGIATSGNSPLGGVRLRGSTFYNTVLDMGIGADGVGNNTWLQATDATDLSQGYSLSLNPKGGNVGIGTANPVSMLNLRRAGGPQITLEDNTATGRIGSIRFASGYNGYNAWSGVEAWGTGGLDQQDLRFFTTYGSNSEKMRITAFGYVGIGTSSPAVKLHVVGDFTATGTKCREVETAEYGKLYYNAVESGNAIFTTSGRARLENGRARIVLDPKWLAGVTIDVRHPLDVTSVVFYGQHDNWYAVPGTDGFDVIESTGANVELFWTVQACQKGYEDLYLNRPEPVAAR